MPGTRPALISEVLTAAVTLMAALLVAGPVAAQQSEDQSQGQQGSENQQTKVVPTMRLSISTKFEEAQACLDEDDTECAKEILDDIAKLRDLNNYELGQLYNFQAFMSFGLDDNEGAIEAYEKIMALPQEDLPDGLISSSMRNLATLYLQEDRLDDGLKTYMAWMDLPYVIPTSEDYYLLASVYYQKEDYASGVPAIKQAIKLANDKGDLGKEQWYVLLYVFYYQLDQRDDVIDTLTILVENWTKRDHILALAGQLSEAGREDDTLSLFEAAYDAGMLERGAEWVQLANLLLNAREPYKAAVILDKGLSSGFIESNEANWRLQAQAWQLAAEHKKALPALEKASSLADSGQVDNLLAQSFARLARWDDCADAAQKAIDRGGLNDEAYVEMQLGQCLVNLRRFSEARTAFQAASRDDKRSKDAYRWMNYIDEAVKREKANSEALARLAAGEI